MQNINEFLEKVLNSNLYKERYLTQDINEFLEKVYALSLDGDLQEATDIIFWTIDTLLLNEKFHICDEILCCINIQKLSIALMRSFLVITASAKNKLFKRDEFYKKVLSEMIRKKGHVKAEKLLNQLA